MHSLELDSIEGSLILSCAFERVESGIEVARLLGNICASSLLG
jgi:hypothetical protein